MTTISVGIPVFNGRKTLERALESALAQTVDVPYEIIIVDDGSTDTSANIALSYELMFPDRVRLIRQKNKGVASARNVIVSKARGSFLTWLDADDYYEPEKLRLQFETILMHHMIERSVPEDENVIVFSDFRLGRDSYSFRNFGKNAIKEILSGSFRAYLWASMTATVAYRNVGPFNESLHRSEDTDWLLRYLLQKQRKMIFAAPLDVMTYHFSTARDGGKVEESLDFMLERYGDIMIELGVMEEYLPRRYWEISNFYHSNKLWDDMWRCRSIAAKLAPARYQAQLEKEVAGIADLTHQGHIKRKILAYQAQEIRSLATA